MKCNDKHSKRIQKHKSKNTLKTEIDTICQWCEEQGDRDIVRMIHIMGIREFLMSM